MLNITKVSPSKQDPYEPEPWYVFHVKGDFRGVAIDCDLSVNIDEGDMSWAPDIGQSAPFQVMPGSSNWEEFKDLFDTHPTAEAASREYHDL